MNCQTAGTRWIRVLGLTLMVVQGATAFAVTAPAASDSGIEKSPSGAKIQVPDGHVHLDVWSDRIVRVRFSRTGSPAPGQNFAVIAAPQPAHWTVSETGKASVLATAQLRVSVDQASGVITFSDLAGDIFLKDVVEFRSMAAAGGANGKGIRQLFELAGNEEIYGLGQHQGGFLSYRGTSVNLLQMNSEVAIPMLTSNKGYGLLWNNASVTTVKVSAPPVHNRFAFESEAGAGIDYYFIAGPKLDDVIAGYRGLTGQAPMMARWTWGYWQSRERYESQKELLAVAARYRRMQIPIDAVVQDWQYWAPGQWGSHEFDRTRYPDPKAMVDELHRNNVHTIISVWPRFDSGTANLAELEKAGAVFPDTYPNVWPVGVGRWYDAFMAQGRHNYWQQISRNLGSLGFDGWWLDGSEAELGGRWGEMRSVQTGAGPGVEVVNAYPLHHTTGVYEGHRRDFPDKRAIILTRSAYAGQQRNAAITWSGDIGGNWEVYRRQIPAGLNFSLSGIPYWNADIGGFFGGKPSDPGFRELYTRWFQFGAFTPMMRSHGTGPSKEMWQFDAATQKILIAFTQLRYRLLPYIYSTSWAVTSHSGTMMRPLVMDFADDPLSHNVADQYMFGSALLVCPVVQARAEARTVYLPGRASWYDFWTGAQHQGGTAITASAPIDSMPLFVRAGSVLPMGPIVQHANEQPNAPLEIRIYRGADGRFELYDDEGDGYGYEKGGYATIEFAWNEAAGKLTIGARKGSYPGMGKHRDFHVVFVGEGSGVGIAATAGTTVSYGGNAVTIAAPGR